MTAHFLVSPLAQKDLRDILRYIAQDNIVSAEQMRRLFSSAFQKLGEHPHMGQERRDLTTQSVRFWPVHRSYMIIYNADTVPVQILRIYNTAQHITSILPGNNV